MTRPSAEPVAYQVDGLTLRGKWWPGEGAPILALHGWMDNAASFDVLAPWLCPRPLLALDLHGHGLSDHKPASGSYAIWEDIRALVQVCDQLGTQPITLLGHSRGAMIASLLASVTAGRFDRLICLDGLVAESIADGDVVKQLVRHVTDFTQPKKNHQRCAALEVLIRARQQAMPISRDAARLILERNTQAGEDGQRYWCSDPRVAGASPVKLNQVQWQAVLNSLTLPALLLCASEGLGPKTLISSLQLGDNFRVETVAGGHHWHMEAGPARQLAGLINTFCD